MKIRISVATRSTIVALATSFLFSCLPAFSWEETAGRRTAVGAQPPANTEESPADETPTIDVLAGIRAGKLSVDARGTGDGRMSLNITNRSHRSLRVVLPPGLVASGAAGQFGGLAVAGGNNNAAAGNNVNGAGANNNAGGMNNNNNMPMNNNNNGGNPGTSSLVLPSAAGMMMLGQLIMKIVEAETWDTKSLMSGMSIMGSLGGGMGGGMAGGMGGGMGAGFRSLPPSDAPSAIVKPNKPRRLPVSLISLGGPNPEGQIVLPAAGEKLQLGEISQVNTDPATREVLRYLSGRPVPPQVAQLALWYVNGGFSWDTVEQMAGGWANGDERTLARQFVDRWREEGGSTLTTSSAPRLFWEVTSIVGARKTFAEELRGALKDRPVLGLAAAERIPSAPEGASLALRIRVEARGALVRVSTSREDGTSWSDVAEFKLKLESSRGKTRPTSEVVDSLAEELLARLVSVRLVAGKVNGALSYRLRIKNDSPLLLDGLVLAGSDASKGAALGISSLGLAPQRYLSLPATSAVVERLKLKAGVRLVAAKLDGL